MMPPQPYDIAAEELRLLAHGAAQRAAASSTARGVLSSEGFRGPAGEAAMARFSGLESNLIAVQQEIERAIPVLAVAHTCEQACLRIIELVQPFLALPAARTLVELTRLERTRINAWVAWALMAAHSHVAEPKLSLLYDDPTTPLSQLHHQNLAHVSAPTRDLLERYDAIVLESGTGGLSVMLGAGFDAESGEMAPPGAITTIVAGTGSSQPGALGGYLDRGQELAQATGEPVVLWLGYTAPETVFFDAVSRSYSHAGADNLSYFQAALAQRFPDATRTVVGHSYGAVTAVRAAAEHGLWADNLVLMGSPGAPALNARSLQLHSSDPQVVVADTSNDPITLTRQGYWAVHGANPASDLFGADEVVRLGTGGHSAHWSHPRMHEVIHRLNTRL